MHAPMQTNATARFPHHRHCTYPFYIFFIAIYIATASNQKLDSGKAQEQGPSRSMQSQFSSCFSWWLNWHTVTVADLGRGGGGGGASATPLWQLVMYFCDHNCTSPSNDYAAVACSNNNQAQLHSRISSLYIGYSVHTFT